MHKVVKSVSSPGRSMAISLARRKIMFLGTIIDVAKLALESANGPIGLWRSFAQV